MRIGNVPTILGVAAALAGTAAGVAAQDAPLRVGIYNLPPYGGDPPGGVCFDLMNAIAERTGLRFEYVPQTVAQLREAVAAGDTNLECSALAPGAIGRGMGLSFTGPIFTINEALAVRANDTTAYTTLADLRGKRVGAPVNTVYVTMLQNAGVTDVRTYANAAEGNGAVIAGEIDAFLQSGPGLLYQHNVAGMWPELRIVGTYVPTTSTVGSIAVRRGDTELLGVLQDALETLKADNALAPILERWALPGPPF